MEFEIFETLGYDTKAPSANHFLVHFFKKGHENRTEDKLNKLYNVSSKTKEEKTRLWNYYMQDYVPGFGDIIGLL
ncbi:hypothetical protein niasHT_032143 [Heterodera trifolii]|uniref:LAGLIDADG endonuclease n=1 Tax=Heterodera trifolii TaxID=157864 RepID=A0ABD2HR32_9BILA